MKAGDLVVGKSNPKNLYEITRGVYTAKFIQEASDWDMIESGLGHLAGAYGSAVDVVALNGTHAGRSYVKQKASNFTVV